MRPILRPPWLRQSTLLPWLPRAAPQSFILSRIATTSASNAAPVDLPKLIISPGSPNHNSLPSFLEYAKRTNLTEDRTIYVGTHYEYTTALALMRLGFSLLRIGRKHDAGIDLIGHWVLAPLREPLPVIIQCKARKISINPAHVRELEGSFQGIPADWRKKDVLGLLVTTKKATKGVLEALGQSRWPMGFVLVTREGTVQQFVWNRAASERGLEGVGVTVRHTPLALVEEEEPSRAEADVQKAPKKQLARKNAGTRKDIQLTWMGSPIFPDRTSLTQETVELMRYVVPGDTDGRRSYEYKDPKTKIKPGRPRSVDRAPVPRGGVVGGKRGRPKVSTTTVQKKNSKPVPSPRARPKASAKSKQEALSSLHGSETPVKLTTRGRPKGSKNKPKPVVDAG